VQVFLPGQMLVSCRHFLDRLPARSGRYSVDSDGPCQTIKIANIRLQQLASTCRRCLNHNIQGDLLEVYTTVSVSVMWSLTDQVGCCLSNQGCARYASLQLARLTTRESLQLASPSCSRAAPHQCAFSRGNRRSARVTIVMNLTHRRHPLRLESVR
jgi:hypothetical protein